MADGALSARETGEILAEIKMIRERLDDIDRRLERGDQRFQEIDRQAAADGVVRKMATRIGLWILATSGAIGLAVLSHVPQLAEWLLPPRAH